LFGGSYRNLEIEMAEMGII